MKQIDYKAAEAFRKGERFKQSNTKVEIVNGDAMLYLFGNLIAKTHEDHTYINHCGWKTITTRNRLNALGANIRLSKGEFIMNEMFSWETNEWLEL